MEVKTLFVSKESGDDIALSDYPAVAYIMSLANVAGS